MAERALLDGFNDVQNLFLDIYQNCIRDHKNLGSIYQHGALLADQGDFLGCLSDIETLIASGKSLDYITDSPSIHFELGVILSESHLYDQAILELTQAIERDPDNKKAYFERALAYFETGNFEDALADYLFSGTKLSFPKSEKNNPIFKLSEGIVLGCLKGSIDSAIDLAPSLLATAYGLSTALWALTTDPIGVSTEFINTITVLIKYAKDHLTKEMLAEVIPELKECLESWENFDDQKKGYSIGYVIGKFGMDTLAFGGCARGLKIFSDLKRANAALTLESAILSSKNAKEITKEAKKHFERIEEYKTKCFLHKDKHNKHVRGAHNFQEGKSEIIISFERMAQLSKKYIGTGIPEYVSFGEANYIEIVNFGEEIGIAISLGEKTKIPTSWGKIHYDKKGGYHVVPTLPRQNLK